MTFTDAEGVQWAEHDGRLINLSRLVQERWPSFDDLKSELPSSPEQKKARAEWGEFVKSQSLRRKAWEESAVMRKTRADEADANRMIAMYRHRHLEKQIADIHAEHGRATAGKTRVKQLLGPQSFPGEAA